MNRTTTTNLIVTALLTGAMLLLGGCAAVTPHGTMYAATTPAPDLDSGTGCARFGVKETGFIDRPFDPQFVDSGELTQACGHRSAMGCYHPGDGKAVILGRDWYLYWHEWCHAKQSSLHTAAI